MSFEWKLKFGLRSFYLVALGGAFCISLVVKFFAWRGDYVPIPPDPSVRYASQEDIERLKKGSEYYKNRLMSSFPSKGLEYWEGKVSQLKNGMASHAINKYLPNAGFYTVLEPQGDFQTLAFPLDSTLAVALRVDTKQNGRFVDVICLFEHKFMLDEVGAIVPQEVRRILVQPGSP